MKTMRLKRIFALFLALAVMSTVIVALPLTVSAVASEHYVEWDFTTISDLKCYTDGTYSTESAKNSNGRYQDVDCYVQPTGNSTDDGSISPTFEFYKSDAGKEIVMQSSGVASGSYSVTTLSGEEYSISSNSTKPALKTGTGHSFKINTKLSSTNYSTCNVRVIYTSKHSDPVTIKYGDDTATNAVNNTEVTSYDFKNITEDEIELKTSRQLNLYYVGIEYISNEPSLELDATELSVMPGDTKQITATLNNSTDQISWSSDNENITVDPETGASTTVTVSESAYNGETATITATAGDLTQTCTVKVVSTYLAASDWIDHTSDSAKAEVTIDEVEDAYVLTNKANQTGSGFSYELTPIIENMPEGADPSTVNGIIEVTYDLLLPSNVSSDFFLDLSGVRDIPGWNPGGNYNYQYGRLAGNSGWSTMRYVGGQNATTNQGYEGASKVADGTTWTSVKFAVNMGKKENIVISYNEDEQVIQGFASTIGKKMYLNVQPSLGTDNNDISIKIKNIKAVYKSAATPNFGTSFSDSGYYTSDNTAAGDKYGVIRFLQQYENAENVSEYGFYFVDSRGNIIKTEQHSKGTETLVEGFYGDLIEIPETYMVTENDTQVQKNDGFTRTYYAKAYVKIDGVTYFSDSIDGTVGENPEWVFNPTIETAE